MSNEENIDFESPIYVKEHISLLLVNKSVVTDFARTCFQKKINDSFLCGSHMLAGKDGLGALNFTNSD